MEGGDWLAIANVVCNTVQVVALAYIGAVVGLNRSER